MDAFTGFLANNYVWFLVITLILFCALIGYLVDKRDIKNGKVRKKEELKVVDFTNVDNSKSLNESIKEENSGSLNLDDYQDNKTTDKKNEKKEETKDSAGTLNLDEYSSSKENKNDLENVNEELPDLDEGNEKNFENEFK